MRSNAFGDLRFSGRDPVEVVDELRTQWLEAGPVLDDEDRAQAARFETSSSACSMPPVPLLAQTANGADERGEVIAKVVVAAVVATSAASAA